VLRDVRSHLAQLGRHRPDGCSHLGGFPLGGLADGGGLVGRLLPHPGGFPLGGLADGGGLVGRLLRDLRGLVGRLLRDLGGLVVSNREDPAGQPERVPALHSRRLRPASG